MNIEERGEDSMQDHIAMQETYTPEILSAEKVRILIPYNPEIAHYNATVLASKGEDEVILLVREVQRNNVKAGVPDKGDLVSYRVGTNKVEEIARFPLFHPLINGWEDARAFVSDKTVVDSQGVEGKKVLIGLTAIRASDNKPVAATVEGSVIDGNFSIDQESLAVYPNDVGKNMTPIDKKIDKKRFLFRPEGFSDCLEVVEDGKDADGKNKLRVEQTIKFPKKKWCEWQIGTQAQFLPGGILPIHGVNRFPLDTDQEGKPTFGYAYSLGLAQLDDDLNVIKMTDMPIFTRQSFKNILPMGEELDTNKDVIYCCGYSVDKGVVKFVINIGDLMTVEVSKSLAELQEALDNSSAIEIEQFPESIAA